MNENTYKDREIDAMLKTLTDFMGEKFEDQNKTLAIIQDGVAKQNGRVRKLEKWQSFIMGGMGIIGVLVLPVIFILINNILSAQSQAKTPTTRAAIESRVIDLQAQATKLELQLQRTATSTK